MMLLGRYNQLIKGYQITTKTFFWRGTHTNKIFVWSMAAKRLGTLH